MNPGRTRSIEGWVRRAATALPMLLFVLPGGPEPLSIEVLGCDQARPGVACELEAGRDHTLTLVPSPTSGDPLYASVDDRPVPLGVDGDGGRRTLHVPAGARSLRLWTLTEGRMERLHLDLGPLHRGPEATVALEALEAGDLAAARDAARKAAAKGNADDAAYAAGALARAVRRGLPSDADAGALFREAVEADRRAGLLRSLLRDHFAWSDWLRRRGRFGEASEVVADASRHVADLGPGADVYAEAKAQLPYYRASAAFDGGAIVTAVRDADVARREATRLGLRAEADDADSLGLELAPFLGRYQDGRRIAERLRARLPELDGCARVERWLNLGWFALGDEGRPGGAPRGTALGYFEAALAGTPGDCADPGLRAVAQTNVAQALVARAAAAPDLAALAAADAALAEARGGAEPSWDQRLEWLELEGRLRLLQGRPGDARRVAQTLATWSAQGGHLAWQRRAALLRAEVALRSGDVGDAEATLREAMSTLEAEARLVPLGGGRDTFLASNHDVQDALITLQLARGASEDAARTAEWALGLGVRSIAASVEGQRLSAEESAAFEGARLEYDLLRKRLDEAAEDDWRYGDHLPDALAAARAELLERLRSATTRALSALPPRAPLAAASVPAGEVRIAYYPSPSGWIGFARSALGAQHALLKVSTPQPEANALRAELFLAPFAAMLRDASRVELMAPDGLRELELHAAIPAVSGAARAQVRYHVGLPAPSAPTHGEDGSPPRTVLVVGDAQGGLPNALQEAADIARLYEERGARVVLLQREAATPGRVRAELENGVDVFHYAGHASFGEGTDAPAEDGMSGALLLANGTLLVTDILQLRHAPRLVVLSACESARSAGRLGLGLAQAFLAAGTESVVATSVPIRDGAANALMVHLHEGLRSGASVGHAFAEAKASVPPGTEVAARFRVLAP